MMGTTDHCRPLINKRLHVHQIYEVEHSSCKIDSVLETTSKRVGGYVVVEVKRFDREYKMFKRPRRVLSAEVSTPY